jgi:phosphatidylinositol alpha-1,6-mannosyltransferase
MSLRVLWVSQDFTPERGGVQTHGMQLTRALVAAGHDVEIVAPRADGDREHDRGMPCPVHRIAIPRDTMPVASAPTVMRLLARGRFDAVVCGQWNTAIAPAIARARGHVGTLAVAAHGRELLWRPAVGVAAYDRARRAVLARADVTFAVSRYTAALVESRGVPGSRIAVVPNGTNPADFDDPLARARAAELRAQHGAPLVVTVARLVPRKGIDTVIRAIARMPAASRPSYAVVGAGPDRERLHRLARAVSVADRMIWIEGADDRERTAWLYASDLVALVSRADGHDVEGFGIALLEAAACCKPVVAGRTGGVPDAVVDGTTGLLCAPEDTDDVRRALESVLTDRDRGIAMGLAGRRRLESSLTWAHAAAAIAQRLSHASGHASVTHSPSSVTDAPHGQPMLDDERAL